MLSIRALDFDKQKGKASFDLEVSLDDIHWWGGNPFTRPAKVLGNITKLVNGGYDLEYTVNYTYQLNCGRCLDNVNKEESLTVKHMLEENTDKFSKDDDIENIFLVSKGNILISKIVSSDIMLTLPNTILCSENCKGICHICGTSLNIGKCSCKIETITDSRFDKIRELLDGGN